MSPGMPASQDTVHSLCEHAYTGLPVSAGKEYKEVLLDLTRFIHFL